MTSIHSQIAFPFAILLASIVFCIVLAVALLFSRSITEQKTEIMRSSIEIISDSIDSRINQLRKLAQSLRQNDHVMSALSAGELSESVQSTLDDLYSYGLQSAILITADGKQLSAPFSYYYENEKMLQLEGYYGQFIASGREEMFSTPHTFPYATSDNPNENIKLSYFFMLRNQKTTEINGSVQLIVSKDSLFTDRAPLIESQFDHFYIVDGSGTTIYSNTGYEACETLEYAISLSDGRYNSFDSRIGENIYFHNVISSYPDWHIIGVVSVHSVNSNARLLTLLVAALGLVGILIVAALSQVISRRITVPFERMGTAMKQFESGTMPEKLANQESGEIGELIYGFNNMLDSIRSNIDTICREQEEKQTAKVTALQYQLQSLQQQINPHFLYNTLNVIIFLAMEKRTNEIRSFVQALNQLLRATLSDPEESVPFQKELRFLVAYAQLMEYRYKDMFKLEFDIEEDTRDCMVPKLILQPLMENALLHGIFPSGRQGIITVRACCIGNTLCVSVSDDGIGIPKERMGQLFEKKRGFSSIGLANINDRIKLCYSGNSGLMISSVPDQGTIVAFYIPAKREEEEL